MWSRCYFRVNKEFSLFVQLAFIWTFWVKIPAHGGILGEDSDVLPGGRVEVRVVVALLGTLVAVTVTIRVLSGMDRTAVTQLIVFQLLISREQTWK